MILFAFWADDHDGHFATLHEAVAAARVYLNENDWTDEVEISRHQVVPLTRASFAEILNNSGGRWSADSKVVKTIRRSKR